MLTIKIKKTHPDAKVPVYQTQGSAGCDVYSLSEVTIKPGELAFISTGVSLEIPEGYFVIMAPRSSLCLKKHLGMPNSIGIGDEDFRGEYIVALRNLGTEEVVIEKHERIAQFIFLPYSKAQFVEVEDLSDSARGTGGFGSTGKF